MFSQVTDRFTRTVTSAGPAKGMTFAGRRRIPHDAGGDDLPLVIAVHGGGYTSAYFDVPGYSLMDRAQGLGVPVIAVNRPGYGGSSPVSPDGSMFLANAAALDHLISELWQAEGVGTAGVFLIGHSVGVPVTMAIAARERTWPLLGLALSGCLLRVPASFGSSWAATPGPTLDSPPDQKAERMFGPEWTRPGDMPEAAYFANVPVIKSELIESSSTWPELFHDIAPRISVPVHLRAGEFDTLWDTSEGQLAEFAAGLASSPHVDAELFPAAGHAIDYHRGGAAFQAQQLAFALTCAARQPSRRAAGTGAGTARTPVLAPRGVRGR